MSQFSAGAKTPSPSPSPPNDEKTAPIKPNYYNATPTDSYSVPQSPATPPSRLDYGSPVNGSPASNSAQHHRRNGSRPLSIISTHQPPLMEINEDTIPELSPIYSFLNSHANKLYQEGYFLKLDDQNTQGRPNQERTWTECFAQLVGTVLSLWDAAELDAAGEDGEVLPKFINLTDASIKMIDSLPTRSNDEQPLQNILSISTAGRNRYLLHFNSHHSLVQWAAGIRLSMFEHSTLQEAYTGALIAGKGKALNNINIIMERSRFKVEEWVRVRFGAGVPWRRCWCVVTPPDEKEYAKQQKELKKKSPYDRTAAPQLKGTINFYDTRKDGKKQKKAQPIATITDAFSAYAIYPQAKSLIESSTLIKIEGDITVHSEPPSSSEGFVFVMPETRPAINGFEMMLRFLFPVWDTCALYGRPGRLVASTLDPRSLMFAMPKHRRYGYLEIIDVASLLVDDNSSSWSEREWRRRLKEVTGARMNAMEDGVIKTHSRSNSRQNVRLSFSGAGAGSGRARAGFAEDPVSVRSSRSMSLSRGPRTDSAPPDAPGNRQPRAMTDLQSHHVRNTSDPNMVQHMRQAYGGNNSPYQGGSPQRQQGSPMSHLQERMTPNDYVSSDEERGANPTPPPHNFDGMRKMQTPEPVSQPPAFNHTPQARPMSRPYHSPELRRANSRLSSTTLAQMANANASGIGQSGDSGAHGAQDVYARAYGEENYASGPSVLQPAASFGSSANDNRSREAMNTPNQGRTPGGLPLPLDLSKQRSRSPLGRSPQGPSSPFTPSPNSPVHPSASEGGRSPYPPGSAGPASGVQHQQNLALRPEQGRPGGPGGPASPYQQGRSPVPGPPSGTDTRDPYGGQRPSPGSRPFPGPGAELPGSSTHSGNMFPHRKPLPNTNAAAESFPPSATDDILDSYASTDTRSRDPYARPPPSERRPLPPAHQDLAASAERPRAGVLKTIGGGEQALPPKSQYDIPDINFGPTVNQNYSAPPPQAQPAGRPSPGFPAQSQRPYSPMGTRPSPAARSTPDYRAGDSSRSALWQPPISGPTRQGGQGVSAEQYVQQRAAISTAQYGHGRSHSGNRHGETDRQLRRRSSADMLEPGRSYNGAGEPGNRPSSQGGEDYRTRGTQQMRPDLNGQGPSYATSYQYQDRSMPPAMGRGGGDVGYGGPQGQPASFSRPLRGDAHPPRQIDPRLVPRQGQYPNAPQSTRNELPPSQGHAF